MSSANSSKKTALQKILIIEDEGDMCLLIDILLNSREIKIDHAHTIHDAMQFLLHEEPTLVLLDNRLPDGYGIDFIGFIKTNHPATKIIMISGFDAAAQDLALELGADTFLSKPFTKTQLHLSIENLLN